MRTFIDRAQVITMDATTGATPTTTSLRIDGGRITAIGADLVPGPGDDVIDGSDRLVTPGLINAHTHSWEYFYKGRYDNLPLEMWMLYAYPILGMEPLPADVVRLRSLLFAAESMRSGVTTVVDDVLETPSQGPEQLAAVFGAYADAGIRANVSGHVINRPFTDTVPFVARWLGEETLQQVREVPLLTADEYLDLSEDAFAAHHGSAGGRLRYMVAPSGPQRCTPDLLVGATQLASKHGAECHVHVLETRTQAVTGQELYGTTLVRYLADLGTLSERTTVAHGIWVTHDDIALLAGAGASVSHNPLSNLKLGSGLAPWRAYQDAGVTLGVGTDGCSSSDTPRVLESVKLAALLHNVTETDPARWPTVTEVLRAGTVGGARTAQLQEVTGSLEVGKRADLLVWDLGTLAFSPRTRLDHQLVYSENGSSLEYVMVDGVVTVDHGRLTTLDEGELLAELRALGPSLTAWQDRLDRVNDVFLPAFSRMHRQCAATDIPETANAQVVHR